MLNKTNYAIVKTLHDMIIENNLPFSDHLVNADRFYETIMKEYGIKVLGKVASKPENKFFKRFKKYGFDGFQLTPEGRAALSATRTALAREIGFAHPEDTLQYW